MRVVASCKEADGTFSYVAADFSSDEILEALRAYLDLPDYPPIRSILMHQSYATVEFERTADQSSES